jgi:broad specificity phosphatase PhoE
MNEQQIYIIRHGNSGKTNEAGILLDDFSRQLSAEGQLEVKNLAIHLEAMGVNPDVIISSLLVRAQETAHIIAQQVGPVTIESSDLIGETNLGTIPSTKEGLVSADYGYNTEVVARAGGETIEEVESRVLQFLAELLNRADTTILVVSHGLTLSVMSQLLQGLDVTFANIQILDTADYSYFVVNTDKGLPATEFQTNVFKGAK